MTQEHQEILEKVKTLYLRYGIKSVTMDDVSRELGMSKKTLYQYFDDKQKLVAGITHMEMDRAKKMVMDIFEQGLDAISEMFQLHRFLDQMAKAHSHVCEYDLKKYYPALFQEIINMKRDMLYRLWKTNIEKGKSESLYRAEVNTEIIAKTNLLRFESSMDTCIFTDAEMASLDFFNEIFVYHVRGIATAKGIKRLEALLAEA
ncbi:TetR family transcriptional regulator [Breznakibacter xylanolyticus]|uniref:TetR family transcriptional regulator n=1 Tax=Breznakibacter xylanolyticus TaxID=990 RepID=A0A2W7N157_9BACT|nr:TetR/AcrR family transcriptional regulator [Breznakibacter xylanolyticus]MBN2745034.1 TetR/AcrR family transcriptional regulator [Marinilabiliaceae bacterium]PZX13711.1 TetR family transcriptional regulator [Breznakibacter xylanolyticus]